MRSLSTPQRNSGAAGPGAPRLAPAFQEGPAIGSCRMPSGSRAASSMSPRTASTGISRRGPTRRRSSSRASRAMCARSPTGSCTRRSAGSPMRWRSSASCKGDRAAIYMPMVPEAAIAMLACARLGVIHTVIFGGFSSEAIKDRVNDCQARLIITADGGWRRGKIVELKANVDRALPGAPSVEHVIVLKRTGQEVPMDPRRDRWWHDLSPASRRTHKAKAFDSEHPLFILYTSGSTGKPKGVLHTTPATSSASRDDQYVFDLKDSDVYFCTADVGWVTGHSYVVYGPLSAAPRPDVRGGAEPPRARPLLGAHRPPPGHDPLHGADGHPRLHALGRRLREARPRSRCASSGGRRADQSRGVDVVPHGHRQEALPDRRHVVADRDGRHHGDAAAGRHADEARARARCRSSASCPRSSDETGRDVPRGKRREALPPPPWPSMLRTLWGDDERYKKQYWSELPGYVILPATARGSTRTATSGSSAGSTTCSTSPATASARPRSRAPSSPIRRWPRPPWSAGPTT
jgi:hypothetical protein